MANDLMNRRNDSLMNQFNNLFGDGFLGFPKDAFGLQNFDNIMQSDIAETDKNYVVKIDMPGMDKKDINLNYENGVLTVSGKRESFDDLSDKDGNILHSERSYGSSSRQYRLSNVNESDIKAKYDGGVLTVTLPKKEQKEDTKNNIEIE